MKRRVGRLGTGVVLVVLAAALAAGAGFGLCFAVATSAFADADAADNEASASALASDSEDEAEDESDDDLTKVESPTLAKDVWEDSAEGWFSSADAGCGEDVSFRLSATLPSNWDEFESYYYAFTDEIDASMSIDIESVLVVLVDAETAIQTDVTAAFDISFADGVLSVVCADLKAHEAFSDAAYGDTVVVTYTAQLDPASVSCGTGSPARNFASLTYTSKPGSDALGKTPEATAKVYSWRLELEKTASETGEALAGASFSVREEASGRYLDGAGGLSETEVALACDEAGALTLTGIDSGTYTVTELVAPEGYELLDAFTVTISAEAETGAPALSASTDASAAAVVLLDAAGGAVCVQVADETTPASSVPSSPTTTDLDQTGVELGVGTIALGAAVLLAGVGWALLRGRSRDARDEPGGGGAAGWGARPRSGGGA